MPNAQYFREQADFCLQMARQMSDRKAAENLREMAARYQQQASDLEARHEFGLGLDPQRE